MKKQNYTLKTALIRFAAVFCFVGLATMTMGNGLTLSNLTVNQSGSTGGTVTFTIQWNNSWNCPTGSIPYNWDAAWVFVKFRLCSDLPTTQFTQGLVSTTIGDHTLGSLQSMTSAGITTSSVVGIDAASNNTGLMLRKTATGTGAVNQQVTIRITNLPPNTNPIDVRVFGIEMVYIPSGNFSLGDGNGAQYSSQSFATSYTSYQSVMITSDNAQTIFSSASHIGISLPLAYPCGWNAFYMMKYEITQGQYADFLNTTPYAGNHYPAYAGTNRYAIYSNGTAPNVYHCVVGGNDKADRAMNYLQWAQMLAYLDWACLRPCSELEYEKAARGFDPATPYQYAWGLSTGLVRAAAISGVENGTETITTTNANVSANNIAYTGGDAGLGPLRAGIFAKSSTTTRLQTGGSYFGVMELTGNVAEMYFLANAGVTSANLGNGTLNSSTGAADAGWSATAYGWRGGSWFSVITQGQTTTQSLQISNRGNCYSIGLQPLGTYSASGGRGGRQ